MSTLTLRHRTATAMVAIFQYWIVAALLVGGINYILDPVSIVASVSAKIAAIVIVAGAYMHWGAPGATIDQALFAGIAWATLAIAVEVIAVVNFGRAWTPLLGSPSHNGLRDLLLLVWIGAPALFARNPE